MGQEPERFSYYCRYCGTTVSPPRGEDHICPPLAVALRQYMLERLMEARAAMVRMEFE